MLADEKPRDSYLGASKLPGVCGLDPYNPRFEVWARMTGRASGPKKNRAMMRGIYLEPVVRDHLHEWKDEIEGCDPPDFHVHSELEFIGSHNDGYARGNGERHTLEIKCPGKESWHIIRDQGLRTQEVLQAQIGAGVRGDDACKFVLHNADEWLTLLFTVPFREELYEYMVRQGELFMAEHVIPDVPPDPFPDETPPDIPVIEGEALDVHDDEEFEDLMERYARYARAKKRLKVIYEGGDSDDDEPGLKEELRRFAVEKGHEEIVGEAGKLYYRPDDTRTHFKRELVQALGPFHPRETREVLEWYLAMTPETDHLNAQKVADKIMDHLEVQARIDIESPEFHRTVVQPYLRAFPSIDLE